MREQIAPGAGAELVERLFGGRQQGTHPRIIDLCFSSFLTAFKRNDEDGGPADWFNDTKSRLDPLIEDMKTALASYIASQDARIAELDKLLDDGGKVEVYWQSRAESAERERDDYKRRLDEAKALAVDAGAAAIGLRAKLDEAVKMLEQIGKGSSGYSFEARATLTRIKGDEA